MKVFNILLSKSTFNLINTNYSINNDSILLNTTSYNRKCIKLLSIKKCKNDLHESFKLNESNKKRFIRKKQFDNVRKSSKSLLRRVLRKKDTNNSDDLLKKYSSNVHETIDNHQYNHKNNIISLPLPNQLDDFSTPAKVPRYRKQPSMGVSAYSLKIKKNQINASEQNVPISITNEDRLHSSVSANQLTDIISMSLSKQRKMHSASVLCSSLRGFSTDV